MAVIPAVMSTLGSAHSHSRWLTQMALALGERPCDCASLPLVSTLVTDSAAELRICGGSALASPSEACRRWRAFNSVCFCFLALKVRLVPVSFEDPEFKSSFSQSFSLYAKYQMSIHQDPPEECGKTEVPLVNSFSCVDGAV